MVITVRRLTVVYGLHLLSFLVLLGLASASAIAFVQPETGLNWQTETGVITAVTADSPAAQAGLYAGDRIVAVDGRPLAALPDASNGKRTGQTLTVTVQRDLQQSDASIILVPASLSTLLLERLPPVLLALSFSVIGIAAAWLSNRRPPATLFTVVCLAAAGVLAAGLLSTFKISLASRLFNLSLLLVAVSNLYFHLHFPQAQRGPVARAIFICLAGLAGLMALVFILPGWSAWRWQPWYAALQWGLRFILALSLAGQVVLLIAAGRHVQTPGARHARLLAAGAGLALAPFLFTWLLPNLAGRSPLWSAPVTFPFLLALPLAYGYTLVRVRLSHWDRTAARLMAGLVAGVLLFSAAGATMRQLPGEAPAWLTAALALLTGLAFWPLARLAQGWAGRVLFDGRYDLAGLVTALSEQLATTLDRQELRRLLVTQLPAAAAFNGAAVWLRHEQGGLRLEPPATLAGDLPERLPDEDALARTLAGLEGPATAAELNERRLPGDAAWPPVPEEATWLPLARQERLLGVLLLGPPSDGRWLDGRERRALRAIAHQATLAVANVTLADALRASRVELSRAHGRLLLAREEERRQLGWALHDGPIQELLAISFQLAALAQEAPALADLRQAVLAQVHTLRQLYRELQPGTLDELGLSRAVRTLAQESEMANDFAVTFYTWGQVDGLPDATAVTLFRAAQEGLANAARHSGATQVQVVLNRDEYGVRLVLQDDGCGFTVPSRLSTLVQQNHFGLAGLAERLADQGGELAVQSRPGRGTLLQAWLPVNGEEAESERTYDE
jgi:signal transduction histidine kinase